MAKKKNKEVNAPKKDTTNYYGLKKEAVERLVNADKKTYPKTKGDPGKQYRSGFLDRIPSWVVALFIKFWFNGAVCYFVFWGLGLYVTDMLDMIVLIGVVMGMVTDLLVNNSLRFLESYDGQNSKWMMFPQKKHWTIFANVVYCMVILLGVISIYQAINVVGNSIKGTEDVIILGVEPILFGIFFMLVDLCFTGIKNLMHSIITDAKKKNGV